MSQEQWGRQGAQTPPGKMDMVSHLGEDTSWGACGWAGQGRQLGPWFCLGSGLRGGAQGRCPGKVSGLLCMMQQRLLSEFHTVKQKFQVPCGPASPGVSTQGLCPSASLGENI